MANVEDAPPVGSWRKSVYPVYIEAQAGIGSKPAGMFSIGDDKDRRLEWTKTIKNVASALLLLASLSVAAVAGIATPNLGLNKWTKGDLASDYVPKQNADMDTLDASICDKRGSCTIQGDLTVIGSIIGTSTGSASTVTASFPILGIGSVGNPLRLDSSSATLLGPSIEQNELSFGVATTFDLSIVGASTASLQSQINAGIPASVIVDAPLLGNGSGGSHLRVDGTSVTLQGNVFNVPGTLSKLDVNGNLNLDNGNFTAIHAAPHSNSMLDLTANSSADAVKIINTNGTTGTGVILKNGVDANYTMLMTNAASASQHAFFGNGKVRLNIAGTSQVVSVEGTGGLNLTQGPITTNGPNGNITSASSITASGFFGNGAGLTNLSGVGETNTFTSSKTFTSDVKIATLSVTGPITASTLTLSVPLNIAYGGTGSANRTLSQADGSLNIDWANSSLSDNAGIESVNYQTRCLVNLGLGCMVSWQTTQLLSGGIQTLNWATKDLMSNGTTSALNWTARNLINTAGVVVANWNTTTVTMTDLSVTNQVAATTLSGSGTSITALNASNIASGTLGNARLDSSSVTLQGNTFNGANQLVKLDGSSKLPSVDGSQLTGISISSVTEVPAAAFTNTTFAVALATVTLTTRGRPVMVTFLGTAQGSLASSVIASGLMVDGGFTSIVGSKALSSSRVSANSSDLEVSYTVIITGLSAASHTFALVMNTSSGTGNLLNDASHYTQFSAREN